jgi:nucleotide-binding universal stress UspA family protein
VYTIVVGVDGSRASWRALAMATGIARRESGAVHACYVVHIPAAAELGVFAVPVPPAVDGDGSELRAEVEQELAGAGATGTFSCRRGDIARELEALAEERRADLIVVGRSRHPSLHVGAAPRRLLAMGRRPVLVVP